MMGPMSHTNEPEPQLAALITAIVMVGTAAHAHGQAAVEWPVALGGNGHWYEVLPLGGKYEISVADYAARIRGAQIVEFEDSGEFEFVHASLASALVDRLAFAGAERMPLREPHLLDASHPIVGWLREARTSRLVDLVLIGDSNIAFEGLGWDHGLQYAMHASGLPLAAIGPTPFNDDGGTVGWNWTKSIGPYQDWPSSLGNHLTSTQFAPPLLAEQMHFPLGLPNTGTGYAWLSSGSASIVGGMFVEPDHPFILEAAPFDLRLQHGLMPGGGRFTPTAWRQADGAALASNEISCASKKYGIAETVLSVPGGFAAGSGLRLTIDAGSGVHAPFFLGWTTLERTDIAHGGCVSVLNWHGGATSVRIASDIESFDGATATRWVEAIRSRQLRHGPAVRALFLVCSGMNDFGLTIDEHETALRRMISHLSSRWIAAGGAPSEIGFVLMTSHDPGIDNPTQTFVSFRARCRAIAAERSDTMVIDLGAIPMESQFYDGGQDSSPHLSQAGYEIMALRILDAIDRPGGAGCEWRWRSGMPVMQQIDSSSLGDCVRARAAVSEDRGALKGIARDSMLEYALVEYRADCDGDGLVDRGAIALGLVQDLNGNLVPDSCECLGDIDQSGGVDSSDLAVLLGRWGQGGDASDLDRSGSVDASDLVILLARWGSCRE